MNYLIGHRVELPPHHNAWIRGDRYGRVATVNNGRAYVDMDKSGRCLRVLAMEIETYGKVLD